MSSGGVGSVDDFSIAIRKLLARAQEIKLDGGVEPTLTTQDFGGDIEIMGKWGGLPSKNYAAIETACRNLFYHLLVRVLCEWAPA